MTDNHLPNHEMNPYIKLEYGLALVVKKACIADIPTFNDSQVSPIMETRRKH